MTYRTHHLPNGRPRFGRIGRARRAAEPLVGIRFVCGGCGRYVVKVTRKPGEPFRVDLGNLEGAAAALGVGWTDGPAGDNEKRNIPCPTCRGPRGEPRALQVYETTITQWLDALEREAGPDTRAVVTYRF